ncbi:hypothetical protein [Glaciecola sp. KUL10]|uniref:hypothetical protein n=1 Tax=Glaciecola sp. (strain KUL10) TaxID=2161813 RepID=UPI000D789A2A|nr:hypothetical protein [Glaciecola sp. KUL10]GBL02955.1 hypothetical protein KUL10_02280 [Glaciecola sp. KUL10]
MSNQPNTTAALQTLEELDGGAFLSRFTAVIREVASGIHKTDKPGEITVKLKIKPNNKTSQHGCGTKVDIESKLQFVKPTAIGKASEEGTTVTQMWINKDLTMTALAKAQDDLFTNSKITSIKE